MREEVGRFWLQVSSLLKASKLKLARAEGRCQLFLAIVPPYGEDIVNKVCCDKVYEHHENFARKVN